MSLQWTVDDRAAELHSRVWRVWVKTWHGVSDMHIITAPNADAAYARVVRNLGDEIMKVEEI